MGSLGRGLQGSPGRLSVEILTALPDPSSECQTRFTESAADGSFAILLPPGGPVAFHVVGFDPRGALAIDLDRDRSDVLLTMTGGGFLEGRIASNRSDAP